MVWKIYYEGRLDRRLTDVDQEKVDRHMEKWAQVRWKYTPYVIGVDPDQSNNRRTILMGSTEFPDPEEIAVRMEADKILLALGELKRALPELEIEIQDSQGRIRYDYGKLRFIIGPPTAGYQAKMERSRDEQPVDEARPAEAAADDETPAGPPAAFGAPFGRIIYRAKRGKPLSVQEEQVIWKLQDHWWKKGEAFHELFHPKVCDPDSEWVVVRGRIERDRPEIANAEILDILSHIKALLSDLHWEIIEDHGRIAWDEDAGVFKEVESPLLSQPEPAAPGATSAGAASRPDRWAIVQSKFSGSNMSMGGAPLSHSGHSKASVRVDGWSFTAEKDMNNTWLNVAGPLENPFPLAAEFRAIVTLRDKTDRVLLIDNSSLGVSLQAGESGTIAGSIPLSPEVWMKAVDVLVTLDYRVAGQLNVGQFHISKS